MRKGGGSGWRVNNAGCMQEVLIECECDERKAKVRMSRRVKCQKSDINLYRTKNKNKNGEKRDNYVNMATNDIE